MYVKVVNNVPLVSYIFRTLGSDRLEQCRNIDHRSSFPVYQTCVPLSSYARNGTPRRKAHLH